MIRILKYGEVANDEIFARTEPAINVEGVVADIIDNVRKNGDRALFEYCEAFDKVKLSALEVTEEEIDEAFAAVEPEFIRILNDAAENIRAFHERQVRNSFILNGKKGVVMGQKVIPIEKVGLYVPGGTAAYPSTVLMDSIPAKIAGCEEIVMVTPPGKDGKVNPAILAAANRPGRHTSSTPNAGVAWRSAIDAPLRLLALDPTPGLQAGKSGAHCDSSDPGTRW